MIKFKPDVRVVGIDSVYSEGDDLRLGIYFNTKNTVIAPKPVLDILFMFNGFFSSSDILSSDFGHCGLDAKKIIDSMFEYKIVNEFNTAEANAESRERFLVAQNRLRDYTIHFRQISHVNIVIAVLLQKLQVKCFFYEDSIINMDYVLKNIYFDRSDIDKQISTVLFNKLGAINIRFESSLDEHSLIGDTHIFVSSDPLNWVDSDKHLVINTWHYKNSRFEDFCLFNKSSIDIQSDLRQLVDSYILAVRSIDDIVYNIKCVAVL